MFKFLRLKFSDRFNRRLLITFLLLALLMFGSAILELVQNKNAVLTMMRSHAHALLETLISSSQNTLLSTKFLEDGYRQRLFNDARMLEELLPLKKQNPPKWQKTLGDIGIEQLLLLSSRGQLIYAVSDRYASGLNPNVLSEDFSPLINGQVDTLILGVRPGKDKNNWYYSAGLRFKDRRIMILAIDANALVRFRWQVGFGVLLRHLAQSKKILYVALQDSNGILAAAGDVQRMPFLPDTLPTAKDAFVSRVVETDSNRIFEATHPFFYQDRQIGFFRMGLPMTEIVTITRSLYHRIWVISAILIFFGIILLRLVFTRERYQILQKQYDVVESYSDLIIENASDAIIVGDSKRVTIINKAAAFLFDISKEKYIGRPFSVLAAAIRCAGLAENADGVFHLDCPLKEGVRYLLVSKSRVEKAGTVLNIYILRDLTHERDLQDQIQRTERLTAMGELASGVAHEIRNPLNTIGTIVQQLDMDFEPADDADEYHTLARLVYKEVMRINDTVHDFLKFSRPEPLKPSSFLCEDWLDEIIRHHQHMLSVQNIELRVHGAHIGRVTWDYHQMQQVMMNLVLNAVQAIGKEGVVQLALSILTDGRIELVVRDDGPGMDTATLNKMFNLYFTTKADGTGIGMAVVQRIVYEHGGVIRVESRPGKGTAVHIIMPRAVERNTK